MKAIRYIISGGTGAVVNIGSFFVLVHLAHVWYLAASVIAFVLSFFVSFSLQRFWTFEQRSRTDLGRHAILYLVTALGNLVLNTLLVYLFVEYAHLWSVLAQVIGGVVVSLTSYFIYQHVVFTDGRV